ncbi:MAG TPA: hypothetical protein VFZ93_06310, partial [Albitalea sp.]
MSDPHRPTEPARPVRATWFLPIVAFVLAAVVAGTQVWQSEQQRRDTERARTHDTAGDHARVLERQLERALSATYSLAALVRHGNGDIPDFDAVAGEILPYYPGAA